MSEDAAGSVPRETDDAGPEGGPVTAPHGVTGEDDLAGFRSPMVRFASSSRTWLAILVVVAMVVPGVTFLADELEFRRSADAVIATLDGERSGAEAADTVLLVRATGCAAGASSGTAFVVDTPDGPALLTNRHVVEDARTVGVRTLDGSTEIRIEAIRTSPTADVAVLDVAEPAELPPALALRDTTAEVGEEVRLVGFPAATPFTAAGTVDEVAPGRLLLDLEVAPGASGSPVVAADGRVIGQVHALARDGRGVATPIDRLLAAIADAAPAAGC